jgi:hypothetical protein
MTMVSSYLHVLDGRLRIKVPEIKNAPIEALKLERTLARMAGITTVKANPKTGNVLFLFEPATFSPDDIFTLLQERGYCQRSPEPSPHISQRLANFVVESAVEATIERLVFALI